MLIPEYAGRRLATLLVVSVGLVACGGGGGGGGGGSDSEPVPEPVRPSQLALEILFPLPDSSTRELPEVVASGVLVDELDGELHPGDVAQFEINGVAPEVDLASGNWVARVPVSPGEQELLARVTDSSGNSASDSVVFHNTAPRSYTSVHVSEDGQSALVSGGDDLRWLDFATREERLIAANLGDVVEGSGVVRGAIRRDAAGNAAWLTLAADPPQLLEIDLQDGAVRPVGSFSRAPQQMSNLTGPYTPPYTPGNFDIEGDRVYFANLIPAHHTVPYYHCVVGYFDSASGERTELVAEQGVHLPGPVCLEPIAFDFPAGRLYGLEAPGYEESGRLNAVDLGTGELTTIFDGARGTGPDLAARSAMFVIEQGQALLTLDYAGIFHFDIASGNRQLLFEEPQLPRPFEGSDLDELNGRLVTTNGEGVFALDLASGAIEVLQDSGVGVGIGPQSSTFASTVVDVKRRRLLVFDPIDSRLLAIDLESLRREVLLQDYLPEGLATSLHNAREVAINEATDRLYFLAQGPNPGSPDRTLVSLDLASSELAVLSPGDASPQIELGNGGLWCLDASRDLLYASGAIAGAPKGGMISIDLLSGARRVVSSDGDFPSSSPVETMVACLHDPVADRLLALSRSGAVAEVNRDNGERYVLVEDSAYPQREGRAADMAWDDVGQRVLLYFHIDETDGQVHAVDLDAGEPVLVATGLATFAYDQQRSLIYSLERIQLPGKARIDVIDRRGGGRATIANPAYQGIP